MSDDLVLYTHPMSRGRIARWMLEEIGRLYRTEIVEYGTTMKAPAYLAINPMGKVPALKHGEAIVTECAAICTYLADAFPDAGLAPPPGDPARAAYLRWMFFAAGPIEAAVGTKAMGFEVPPDKRGMAGWGSFEAAIGALAGRLEEAPYLAGDRFTAADVYAGSQIGFGLMFGSWAKRAPFEAYFARIAARPAAIRAKAIDDELMAKYPMPSRAAG